MGHPFEELVLDHHRHNTVRALHSHQIIRAQLTQKNRSQHLFEELAHNTLVSI